MKRGASQTELMLLVVLAAVFVPAYAQSITSPTLDAVKDRGRVVCGVNDNQPGFASANSLDEYSGLHVDLCQALAAAIFNDREKTQYVSPEENSVDALTSGEIDVLIGTDAWRFETNVTVGNYAGIHFFDGQGFLVWKRSRIRTALELDNTSLCVTRESDGAQRAKAFFASNQMRYKPVFFDDEQAAVDGYTDGACSGISANLSTLASLRVLQADPDAHRLLGSVISKEPLGPMVRPNDTGWENVVRWSLNCMINAEELGITRTNVSSLARSRAADTPTADIRSTRELLGQSADLGAMLGLDKAWCVNIVRTVGNYEDAYAFHSSSTTHVFSDRVSSSKPNRSRCCRLLSRMRSLHLRMRYNLHHGAFAAFVHLFLPLR